MKVLQGSLGINRSIGLYTDLSFSTSNGMNSKQNIIDEQDKDDTSIVNSNTNTIATSNQYRNSSSVITNGRYVFKVNSINKTSLSNLSSDVSKPDVTILRLNTGERGILHITNP